jgi:formylglycine-generating enzyme required for sulfatase activity
MRNLEKWWVALALAAGQATALAQLPAAGTTFRDCADCPEMVVVPAGSYRMGSTRDRALTEFETPRHEVRIGAAFAVGRFEVSRAQFAAFVKESGHAAFQGKGCSSLRHLDLQWVDDDARDWRSPGFEQGDDHPAVCVSWDDAKAYAEWLAKKTGKKYRLLSEAEWEYAALGGARDIRPWGDDEKAACQHANVWDETYQKERGMPKRADRTQVAGTGPRVREAVSNPFNEKRGSEWFLDLHWCADAYAFTAPSGKYSANAYGLNDMIGNAWEWVEDCLNATYTGAPEDGSAWQTGACANRVLRGGSWSSVPADARAVQRFFRPKQARRADFGFRIAMTLQ